MSEIRIILTTIGSEDAAAAMAKELVTQGAAACVNIVPGVRSIYRWKGEVCDDAELLMIVKVAASRADEASALIKSLHPYELPEIVVLDPSGGSADYFNWVLSG